MINVTVVDPHSHPRLEEKLGLSPDHVIIDKDVYMILKQALDGNQINLLTRKGFPK